MPVSPGSRLGAYEILTLLGAGGMGEVYVARDPRLGREVAIKVLPDEVSEDADRLARFEREARAAAALNHPNVVVIHELSRQGDAPFVVMELLAGETLRQRLDRGLLRPAEALESATQVARGLAVAHSRGIVHRDLKPENLFLTRDGVVKILDFGLALLQPRSPLWGAGEKETTASGVVVGTVGYLSPEQLEGGRGDARSDIFSLGVVLYESLAGRHPFRGRTGVETLAAVLRQDPAGLSDAGISRALEEVVRRCLEKDPGERFQSAHDLALALESLRSEAPARVLTVGAGRDRGPYPGLAAFDEEDRAGFFGREEEAAALWDKIPRHPLLALIGPSGVGKTSFLRAGLVPARPRGWRCLHLSPGPRPVTSLGRALAPELESDPEALRDVVSFDDPDVAVSLFTRWRRRHVATLLIVDQFEELFTLSPPDVRERFVTLLWRLTSESDVHVLLSLRDDFFFACQAHPPLRGVFEQVTPLGPLEGEALRRALVEPARRHDVRFEDDTLVEEMCAAVEGERGALPLLAFCAAQLWARRDREGGVITRDSFEGVGGVAGALSRHAETTLAAIGGPREGLVRELFRNLVTAEGTRATRDREELLSVFDDRTAAEQVLEQLVDARLLTSYQIDSGAGNGGSQRVEIVHESLLTQWPRLVRWQMQDAEGAKLRDELRQAAQLWDERGRSDDRLWSGTPYQEFRLWRERYPGKLSTLEEEFAGAMGERARRRRNVRRGAVAASFALLASAAVAIGLSRQQAVAEARRAEASKLLAVAQLVLEDDPTEALAYATASLELADALEARVFAVRALAEGPPAVELDGKGLDTRIPVFSPDGSRIGAVGNSPETAVWRDDGAGPLRLGGLVPSPDCANLASWPSSELIVTGLGCGLADWVHVWSLPEGKRLRTVEFGRHSAWSVGAERLFARTRDDTDDALHLRSWRLPDGEPEDLGRIDTAALDDGFPSAFEPEGRGWLYAKGREVFRRPLPAGRPSEDVLVDRHPEEVDVLRSPLRVASPLWSRDRSGELHFRRPSGGSTTVVPRPSGSPEQAWPSASGRWFLWLGGRDAQAWDASSWSEARPLRFRRSGSWFAGGHDLDPAEQWLVVSTHNRTRLTFWPLEDVHPVVVEGHSSVFRTLAFSPDGRHLATSWSNEAIRLWPLPGSGERAVRTVALGGPAVTHLTFAPDGAFLLAVGHSGPLWFVPLDGSAPRSFGSFPEGTKLAAGAVSPRGRLVATAPQFSPGSKTLYVWDLDTGRETRLPLPETGAGSPAEEGTASRGGYEGAVFALHFQDEATLLTAGDGGLRRWNLATGTHELVVPPEGGTHAGLLVSADGRAGLVTSQTPGRGVASAALVDLASGERHALPPPPAELAPAIAGALDATGANLVRGHLDGLVSVQPLAEATAAPHLLPGHEGPPSQLAASPDGRWIASLGEDRTLRLWPMPDLATPPLQSLPQDELVARLRSLTNLRAVQDEASSTGWSIALDPFPGWRDVPSR